MHVITWITAVARKSRPWPNAKRQVHSMRPRITASTSEDVHLHWRIHGIGEEQGITFCNVVVLAELILSTLPPHHQPNTLCVPKRVDFQREIANHVLTEHLRNIERATRVSSERTLEARVELGLWQEPNQRGSGLASLCLAYFLEIPARACSSCLLRSTQQPVISQWSYSMVENQEGLRLCSAFLPFLLEAASVEIFSPPWSPSGVPYIARSIHGQISFFLIGSELHLQRMVRQI